MTQALITKHLSALAEDIQSCFVERGYNAREEILRAHHETGAMMDKFLESNTDISVTNLVKRLEALGAAKQTTLWLSHQCFQTWPAFEAMVDATGKGKAASWNDVRRALSAPKAETEKEASCKHCELHCHD